MMKKILILLIFSLTSCVMMSKKYEPQPIVIKEITNYPGAVKVGSLILYAENYVSQADIDYSKAGLKVVMLTLQNVSQGALPTTHQIISREIHGVGSAEYMPYPFLDVITLIENSEAFQEGLKGAAVGTGAGALAGAGIGAMGGAIAGDPGIGAAIGAFTGGVAGGTSGIGYYKSKAMQAVYYEVQSRVLPEVVSVSPDSKTAGILFYPHDTHTLRTNIEGVTYYIEIH